MGEMEERGEINNTPCEAFYVEDKASSLSLVQELKRNYPRIPILGIPHHKNIWFRLQEVLPYIEAGRLHLPLNTSWTQTVIDELTSFTEEGRHKHDDILDTIIDALNIIYVQRMITVKGVWGFPSSKKRS